MTTRIPLYLAAGHSLPVQRATNGFPFACFRDFGSMWVSSNGWDSITDAYGSGKVERFSLDTATKQAEIVLGTYPAHGGGKMASSGGYLFVVDQLSGELVKIDPTSNTIVTKLMIGAAHILRGLCVGDGKLFVSDSTANTVVAVDPASMTVLATISTPASPRGSAYANGKVYVPCFDANSVKVIDATSLTAVTVISITSGVKPVNCYTDPVSGKVLALNFGIANAGGNTVTVIDPSTDTIVATWNAMWNGGLHDARRIGDELWLTCSQTNYILCLDANTGAAIRQMATARDPAFTDFDGSALWVACALDNKIQIWPAQEGYVG